MTRLWLWLLLLITAQFVWAQTPDRTIRPGDRLKITCEEEPSVSKEYVVSSDGKILVVFLGVLDVQGLTANQCAAKIAQRLENDRIVRQATVTCTIVSDQRGVIHFGGAVAAPGDAPLSPAMRLSDLIKIAKPLAQADLTQIQIAHANGDASVVNYTLNDASNGHNPAMIDGDTVTFPMVVSGQTILILGGVSKPGAMEFRTGMTLRDAITAAGGFTALAASSAVRLERVGQPPKTLDTKVEQQALTPLRAGDRLIVATMGVRRYVNIQGGVRNPGSVEYVPGLSLMEAVQKCGGLTENARPKETKVTSPQGQIQTVDLELISSGYMADVPLDPNARVDIPGGAVRSSHTRVIVQIAIGILLFLILGQ